jgi:glutamine synthetase adenylyltransferase
MDERIFFPLQQGVIMVEGFYNLMKKQIFVRKTNHILQAYILRISMMLKKSMVGLMRLVMMRQIDMYKKHSSKEGEERSLGKTLSNFRNEIDMTTEWVKETQIF